jgi:hypothetical protein
MEIENIVFPKKLGEKWGPPYQAKEGRPQLKIE